MSYVARALFVAFVGIAALSGCAVSAQRLSPDSALQLGQRRAYAWSQTANSSIVYVTSPCSQSVEIFSQAGEKQKPVGSIDGPTRVYGLAVDGSGNLYVADGSASIQVFAQGQSVPFEELTGDLEPGPLAVDVSGDIYAVDFLQNEILAYAAGTTAPAYALTVPSGLFVSAVAVDADGDVFVGTYGPLAKIFEFPAGSTTPTFLRDMNQMTVVGLAVDAQRTLLVLNVVSTRKHSASLIVGYAPPYTSRPVRAFTSKHYISGMALNADDSALWFADVAKHVATQLSYPALKPVESTSKEKCLGGAIATYPPAPP